MSIADILHKLDKVTSNATDQYRASCPSHNSQGQTLSLRELNDGRVLIHCFAGCSPTDVMESIGMALDDLYEKSLLNHIQPLYMARKEQRRQDGIKDEKKGWQLRLDMADQMRQRGMKLTVQDLQDERKAFMQLRGLKQMEEYK